MIVDKMILSMCDTNCYYIYEPDSGECILIDPADRGEDIYKEINGKGLKITAMLLTHGHFDHILGCRALKELTGATIYAYEGERALLNNPDMNCSNMVGRSISIDADCYLRDGEGINLNGYDISVISTPGHTSGSCCFYIEGEKTLFSGDTLFNESVGRTDLPTGSYGDLLHSLHEKLGKLPDETVVYPGHGIASSIGHEKAYNPFW